MKAIDRPFTQIINGTTQFIIPVFQRDYRWTEDQCLQLWNDIVRTAQADSERGHFLGSIVYVATGDTAAGFTRWLVVDGQQRLTTLTLLLTALRNHIKETDWTGGEDSPTPQRIDAYFLKNIQESGNRLQKLVLRRTDDETLRSLVNGGELPEDYSAPIVDAYEQFMELLSDVDPDVIYRGIARLIVVDVTLDRHTDDPQLVFESLNSTGIDLSQADLIRNFVLMRLPEAEQTRLYEQYWSRIESLFRGSEPALDSFARDYVAFRTKATKQTRTDQIYDAFRDNFSELLKKDGGLEETLRDMTQAAQYYAAFSLGRTRDGAVANALRNVRHLVDAPAMLITRLYQCHDRIGSLSEDDFIKSLTVIESYIFRRAICGLQTRGYWSVFASIASQVTDQEPFQSLRVALARLRENYRFPSDEEFRRALLEKDLYGLRVCWHLLERLENAGSKEPSDTTGYSIEHIMPQNEKVPLAWRKMLGPEWRKDHDVWIHRLGNLTLTGYNATYSDRPFEEKKTIPDGFNESAVRLNKFVREQTKWTANEMEDRGEALAGRALEIWRGLQVDQGLIDEADVREMRELAARRNAEQVTMTHTAKALFDALREQILGLGDVIELVETKSVSYHAPSFFVEVLPRTHGLLLLLPLDFGEVDDPDEITEDAGQWKFIPNANYDGGVVVQVWEAEQIDSAMPMVRQALNTSAG